MSRSRILLALITLALTSAPQAREVPPEYQTRLDHPDTYEKFPLIEFSVDGPGSAVHYLRIDETGKNQFETRPSPPGTQYKLRGYLLARNLIESQKRKDQPKNNAFEQGPDFPNQARILQALQSSDTKEFSAMLTKLGELRRGSETADELAAVKKKMSPNADPLDDALWKTQIYYGSGFLEVEEETGRPDAKNRKFIPVSDVLQGNVAIDLEKARVSVLKSTLLYLIEDDLALIQETNPAIAQKKAALLAALERLGPCSPSPNCVVSPATFTQTLTAMLALGVRDETKKLKLSDPKYEEKLNALEFEKIRALRATFGKACP